MLGRKYLLALVVCLAILILPGFAWANGGSDSHVVTYLGNGTELEKIIPQEKEGVQYLFLPSEADYTSLPLSVADGKTFRGTVEGVSLSSADINGQRVDLTRLFGEMTPGKPWDLQVYEGETLVQAIRIMKSANLPSMYLTLDGTDLSYIHKSKSNSAKGQFMYRTGSGEFVAELSKFKGRGNSSWRDSKEKKPYNIKLGDKLELIDGAGAAKDWCLLSNNAYDNTGVHNYLAYNLYDMIGGASALKTQTFDLYVNHQYRGTYFLTEKVEIKGTRVDIKETEYAVEDEKNKTLVTKGEISDIHAVGFKHKIETDGKRLTWLKAPEQDPLLEAGIQAYQYATNTKVDVPGGYLIEMDATFYQETSWFITRRGTTFVVKEPEYVSKEQIQQIALYVQDFEDAFYADSGYNSKGKYYGDYIDMDSFVKRFAVDTVMNNHDMMDKSCYFYIDVEDNGLFGNQVLYAGPAWDYDRCNLNTDLFFMYKQYVEPDVLYAGRQEWARQFVRRGGLMEALTDFSNKTLRPQWKTLAATMPEVLNTLSASQAMNQIWCDTNFAEDAVTLANHFGTHRYRFWVDTLFNGATNLLGVSASYDEPSRTLRAEVSGTASSLQWYAVGPKGEMAAIAGATGEAYQLPADVETGRYCVAATGANPAVGCYADSAMITMYSDVIKVGKSVVFKAENQRLDHGEILVKTGGSLAKNLWPAVPEKTGYTGTWNVTALNGVTKNTVVEAVYTPNQYAIVYNGNGAEEGKMKNGNHTYDTTFVLKENVYKRRGYWFQGWNTKADGTGQSYKNKAEVSNLVSKQNGQIKLYAQWGVMVYKLSYKNLKQLENLNPATYTIEDRIVLKPLTHKDYLFLGWTWKGQEKPVKRAVIKKGTAGSLVLTANWKQLPAPKNVKAMLGTGVGGYDDIKVTWKKSKGAAGYHVYYKKTTDTEFTFAKAVKGTSFTKKNLEAGTQYKVKVVPYFRSAGKKYLSTTAKTVTVTTLKKVTDVKVVKAGKQVKVSWTNIDGESGYQISQVMKKKDTQKTPAIGKGADCKAKKLDAEKGKTFYYKVRAYKTVDGEKVYGPWSDAVSFVRK